MAEFKTIPLADIIVPERLRLIEEDHALAISASIVEHGLINAITVRRTPPATKPFRPFTLIAGAHRMRAVELLDESEIEAAIVEADKEEAILVEITENLFRNELSALDRAMFVMKYREAWEEKYGKVARGGDRKSGDYRNQKANLADLIEDEAKAGFSTHVADRLGLSERAIRRAQELAQKLSPDLRQKLRGTPDADNQSLLLKLAKLEPSRQRMVALAYAEEPDIARALDLTDPHAKAKASVSEQQEILSRLLSTWSRADQKTKEEFLKIIGAAVKAKREKYPSVSDVIGGES